MPLKTSIIASRRHLERIVICDLYKGWKLIPKNYHSCLHVLIGFYIFTFHIHKWVGEMVIGEHIEHVWIIKSSSLIKKVLSIDGSFYVIHDILKTCYLLFKSYTYALNINWSKVIENNIIIFIKMIKSNIRRIV